MNKLKHFCFILLLAATIAPSAAFGAPGPVKISAMMRVENHSNTADATGNAYSSETFGYTMFSFSRELQKNVVGSLFYLNQYRFDNQHFNNHIGGVSLIRMFSPKWIGSFGYTFSNSPETTTTTFGVTETEIANDRDRFNVSMIHNFNPKASNGPKYSATTSYSTVTGLDEQKTISEKLDMTFPVINKNYTANVSYNFTYGLDRDSRITVLSGGAYIINPDYDKRMRQLTNQYSANLTYKMSKDMRLVLGLLYVNNVFSYHPDDDMIIRLSLLANLK